MIVSFPKRAAALASGVLLVASTASAATPAAAASLRPTITSLSTHLSKLQGGSTITAHGRHLAGVTSVTVGGTPARRVGRRLSASLTLIVPARREGAVYVRGHSRHGTSAVSAGARLTYVAPPVITAVSPGYVVANSTSRPQVTLTGRNLGYVTYVYVGRGELVSVRNRTATRLTFTAPKLAASAYRISLGSPFGLGVSPRTVVLTYLDPPSISTDRLAPATAGRSYTTSLASADHRPGTWSLVGSALPQGLRLSGAAIVGTPLSAGRSELTLRFTDRTGQHVDRQLELFVASGRWQAGAGPVPPGGVAGSVVLSFVDCPTATWCAAEGSYADLQGNDYDLLATWADGVWSTSTMTLGDEPVLLERPTSTRPLSCSGVGMCAAVGRTDNSRWATSVLQNGTWTTSAVPDTAAGAVTALRAVSCASTSLCVAVGEASSTAVVDTWDGADWSTTTPAQPGESYLTDVDCADASHCTAVGTAAKDPLLLQLNDGTWDQLTVPEPAGLQPGTGERILLGVACPTATSCTAVGGYDGQALVTVDGPDGWASSSPLAERFSTLTRVACSTDRCVMTGTRHTSPDGPIAVLEQGGSFTTQPLGDLYSIDAVGCTPSGPCTLVGRASSPGERTSFGVIDAATGASPVSERTPVPTDAAAVSPGSSASGLNAVSCPTDDRCVMSGNYLGARGSSPLIVTGRP